MLEQAEPPSRDLVLIGGGHSHVEVLRGFAMRPPPGVRITLIARDVHTPYSGMLPGYVAGHYDFDDVHIDLRPLCRLAGARLFHDSATLIDTDRRVVHCAARPPVPYDVLSINTGAGPRLDDVPGARAHATPVKPINRFVARWHALADRVGARARAPRIAVIGTGAAGVELLLAIQFRLRTLLGEAGGNGLEPEFHLIGSALDVLPNFPPAVRARFARVLRERGVHLHLGAEATRIDAGTVMLAGGETVAADEILLVTRAGAPDWPAASGFRVDARGFIEVDACLQVLGHDNVFAAGDIASVVDHPREKAGVFAVRQGLPLAENLRRVLANRKPKPFRPQKTALALISTGDRYAVAAKGPLSIAGRWVWTWKDRIDRDWMGKYRDLPPMSPAPEAEMRCGGCGAKVGADILTRVLADLEVQGHEDIEIDLARPDDAAAIRVPDGQLLVQSVDHFRSFVDDPYVFGKIAANHALGDLHAMGARPHSALAIATVPFGPEALVEDTLRQAMTGAVEVLNRAGAALIGGHTGEGAEFALGFAVNGLAGPGALCRKTGMRAGDALILTKPLGTGTLLAADMRGRAKGRWVEAALTTMMQSNGDAGACLTDHGVRAMTDVTGFGLLGHLGEMLTAADIAVELDPAAIPVLDGALEMLEMGIASTLQPANRRFVRLLGHRRIDGPCGDLLFDPQTAGGLLAALPENRANACLAELQNRGFGAAAVIGHVVGRGDGPAVRTMRP